MREDKSPARPRIAAATGWSAGPAVQEYATLPAGRAPKRTRRYASQHQVVRAVRSAKAAGLLIDTIDLLPDGTVRVSSGAVHEAADLTDFDAWARAGKL